MTVQELRKKFLAFFASKGHKIIPSSSLIPEADPTVLFTTAGMHPLVPYLLGQPHPLGKRLANVQKCLRTTDIDEVGDASHLSFFEMLGNWSLGDYFKQQAIEWSFEFLTKVLELPVQKLAVSVFKGDKNVPKDEESSRIWQDLGIPEERIVYLGKEDNWWGPAGKTGPAGPDTEMFYWTGSDGEAGSTPAPIKFDPNDPRWFEVWNDVFMEYEKTENGDFVPLNQKNVDTGMGLERMLVVLQNKENVFQTEVFSPLIDEINRLKSKSEEKWERIVADHLKASVFILAEQVRPSNLERGYVLRRLIRRAVRFGKLLGIEGEFARHLAEIVINLYKDSYPELEKNKNFILGELELEKENFLKTLKKGLKELEKVQSGKITGKQAFDLYQTYGFPLEMTRDIARERGWQIDEEGFGEEFQRHQELSRVARAGTFRSGLADNSQIVIRYHTATHLLHQALREVLGKGVGQMGSNITSARLRFDFSFDRKLREEEVKKVEDLVNQKIKENLKVKREEMPLGEALKSGALSFFKEKYPERVSVYSIYDEKTGRVFSKEICTGPHVERTGELQGKFKIIKEESLGRGVRRLRAILVSD